MAKDKYEEEWEEKFTKNIEVNKISKDISDVLNEIEKNCLRPLIYFLKSIPSGFAPLPLNSLETILQHSENEYITSSYGAERNIESEIRSLGSSFWFDMVMGGGPSPLNPAQLSSHVPSIFNHYMLNQLRYGFGNDDSKSSGLNQPSCENSSNNHYQDNNVSQKSDQVKQEAGDFQKKVKNFKIVISLQQMLHIYRIGGINNENVWTALFGTQVLDTQSDNIIIKYIMPSFLSNKILMDAYSNIIQVSEPQNNSMQIYMYCRNILKHFCTEIITPRILIHANIFLLWNSTLKDFFNNKTYEKFLSDLLNKPSDASLNTSITSETNYSATNDNIYSLYTGLLGGTLPSLLLLKVLEEEFAKFSVLTHFLIRIFGYLDRNSCHVFSNSPDLSITALLYFYKCVFFPLSSSFTAALLNIITVERDFFIQTCIRSLFSSIMNDRNVFNCIESIENEILEMDEADEVEEILIGTMKDCERKSLRRCRKENHFSIVFENINNSSIAEKFPEKDYNRILFNIINNIILIMSNNSNNKISLRRTNTSGFDDDLTLKLRTSSSSSSSCSSNFLNRKGCKRGTSNIKIEKKVTGLNRTSRTIDPYRDLEESMLGLKKECKISGLFWFAQEEIDQTVYKNTIEEPFLRGTLYYYYNRLESLFSFLDLKQSCILVNSILTEEEKRVIRIFPKKSHSGFFKLLESVLFYFLSRKLLESYRQSICGIIFLSKKEVNNKDMETLNMNDKILEFNSLFKGSIRSYINNDNYCALRSIYFLFLKDTLRSNSHNILNKILMKSEICNQHKKLEFPIGSLNIDISKISSLIGSGTNNSNNKTISSSSFRQSCFVYLGYVIYESIIEDITKVFKIENDDVLKGVKNNSIKLSDRFLSIQIILSLLKRYRRFVKISFENDKALRNIIYRGFYDGLILYLQNSVSPNNHSFVLFILSVWINSFIDSRIIQIQSIFSSFNNCKPKTTSQSSTSEVQACNKVILLHNKSTLRVFSKFVFDWFNKFLVKRYLFHRDLSEIEEMISNAVSLIDEILESKDFSKLCNILINNAINSICLIKLLPNFEVIISLYKDRLCKRLLNIKMMGANSNLPDGRESACTILQVCLEYFVLLCLEKSRLEGEYNYLGGEVGISELVTAIESDGSFWIDSISGSLNVENSVGEDVKKSFLDDDCVIGDSMNVSLNSLRSLLGDFLGSIFFIKNVEEYFQVFLTSNFNWRKISNYVATPVTMSRSSFDNEINQKNVSMEFFSSCGSINKNYTDVNLPDKIKKELINFELEYKKEFPHRKINWLWENGFVVLDAKGFKARVFVEEKEGNCYEIIDTLVNFTIISSLSVSIILLKMGELRKDQVITLGELESQTCLPMLEVARILLSLSLPTQKLVKVIQDIDSKQEVEITKEKIINWSSWLNKDILFTLTEVVIQKNQDLGIFQRKIQFYPKILSKELFLKKGLSRDYYLSSVHFNELFENLDYINCHEYFQIPKFDNCFCNIYQIKYPWNGDFILDNDKYQDYFNSMSNIIGSDDLFFTIINSNKNDNIISSLEFIDQNDSKHSQCKTFSFIYRDNFGILFNESYNVENLNESMVIRNSKQFVENQNSNTFTSVIIDNENSLRRLLNQIDFASILKNGRNHNNHHQLKDENNIFDSKSDLDENPTKKRCISNCNCCVNSTSNETKPKISSTCSNFSISSSSSSSLIYMGNSSNGQLLNNYFSGMIDISCKIESIIVRFLKKSKYKSYSEILELIQKTCNHSSDNIPSISSINMAIIKLIKRDFIKILCKHQSQQCNCNEISQSILSYNGNNSEINDLFSQNSIFEYIS